MHFIYLLYSQKHDRFYVGHSNNLGSRLLQQNSGKVRSQNRFFLGIIYTEEIENEIEARKREKYLKSAAGRRIFKGSQGLVESSPPARLNHDEGNVQSGGNSRFRYYLKHSL
jgi:putative endonuclease